MNEQHCMHERSILGIAMNSDMAIIINLFVLPDKFKKSFVLLYHELMVASH